MTNQRMVLWCVWTAMFATLALYVWVPTLVPRPPVPWNDGEVAVARFVTAILSLVASVGTFALRESLALKRIRSGEIDPTTPVGHARIRVALISMWALCDAIGILGLVLAVASSQPPLVIPYVAAAALLLVLHRPQPRYFVKPAPGAV